MKQVFVFCPVKNVPGVHLRQSKYQLLVGEIKDSSVLPTITAEGKLAGQVQIIWAGETDRCHPKGGDRLNVRPTHALT